MLIIEKKKINCARACLQAVDSYEPKVRNMNSTFNFASFSFVIKLKQITQFTDAIDTMLKWKIVFELLFLVSLSLSVKRLVRSVFILLYIIMYSNHRWFRVGISANCNIIKFKIPRILSNNLKHVWNANNKTDDLIEPRRWRTTLHNCNKISVYSSGFLAKCVRWWNIRVFLRLFYLDTINRFKFSISLSLTLAW